MNLEDLVNPVPRSKEDSICSGLQVASTLHTFRAGHTSDTLSKNKAAEPRILRSVETRRRKWDMELLKIDA
jgi:hypothetical protein